MRIAQIQLELWANMWWTHAPINMKLQILVNTCSQSIHQNWWNFVHQVLKCTFLAQNASPRLFTNNEWRYQLKFMMIEQMGYGHFPAKPSPLKSLLIGGSHIFGLTLPNYNVLVYLNPARLDTKFRAEIRKVDLILLFFRLCKLAKIYYGGLIFTVQEALFVEQIELDIGVKLQVSQSHSVGRLAFLLL